MAWYNGNFKCGCDGRVNVIGPHKQRQWKIDKYFSDICPECKEKEYLEKNEAALKASKEMELLPLSGSPKQIQWANTLRIKIINIIENHECLHVQEMFDYLLNIESAKWFIDNRNDLLESLQKEYLKYKEENTEDKKIEKILLNKIKIESTIIPDNAMTKSAVEIILKENEIKAYFEKDNKFIEIVKSLGYRWKGVWTKYLNKYSGDPHDRIAELGNILLNAGYPIIITDEKIREKAINGDYKMECSRWIRIFPEVHKYKDRLCVSWNGVSDIYKNAKKITSAKWGGIGMAVKIEYYDEVLDFAEIHGFKISNEALKFINEYKNESKKIKVVSPSKAKNEIVNNDDKLKNILNSSDEILEDMRDE